MSIILGHLLKGHIHKKTYDFNVEHIDGHFEALDNIIKENYMPNRNPTEYLKSATETLEYFKSVNYPRAKEIATRLEYKITLAKDAVKKK